MQKKPLSNKLRDGLILGLILVIALLFRLYKIDSPLADRHSWRQADTAAVARNFVNKGFNLLEPRYDDLSNIQSGAENPEGYRMVEFPIYNAIFGFLYKSLPFLTLEVYGRLTTAFFSLAIIAVIYILLLKEANRLTAIIGSLIYATMPFFVFYSRVILPESTALGLTFISILSIYFFSTTNKKSRQVMLFLSSILFFALGLLVKPPVVFFGIVHFYIFFKKYKIAALRNPYFYLFFILSVVPLFLWRSHIQNFAVGIPRVDTLITSINAATGKENIFFRPAFFRWVFFERINNLILGGYLTVFFILGALTRQKKYVLTSILLSSFAYLFVFQGGNVQHEYYQTLILPFLAIFAALGVNFIQKNYRSFITSGLTTLIIVSIFLFSWLISFYQVRDNYSYPEDLVQTANIIRDLTERDDKIVTDTTGDTTLLYLAERRGAPAVFKSLPELQRSGYKYFFTYNKELTQTLKNEGNYTVVFESEKFTIFQL